jgi:hypothetical protein
MSSNTSLTDGHRDGADTEKGDLAATPAALAKDVDETEYPTGFRFWAVVAALVMTMLLVYLCPRFHLQNRLE